MITQKESIKSQSKGFTLIETIMYLALFAIIIGGGMVAAYQIIQSAATGTNHVIMEEEANFLLRKIAWAMTGGKTANPSATSLAVTKYDGTVLTFSYNSVAGTVALNSTILNASSVTVAAMSFATAGNGGVTTTFTLTTMQNGKPVTESFSTTKYLY